MCGIAGYIGQGDSKSLEQMIFAIRHRGPDNSGVWAGDGVGFAHARLAIIDLSPAGQQPMWDEDHKTVIIFNGEIYNFRELRDECVKDGYAFRGHSDTEVILALYKKHGDACIERLNGMFAIALYDTKTKSLLLARDRTGKKPLYYGVWNDTLVFGSEPKALFAHAAVRKEINADAVEAYLALDYVPTPLSIYKDMYKLAPATILTYKDGVISTRVFWHSSGESSMQNIEDAILELDRRFAKAVESRLVSDVPLGVFLSGGIDSSAVAYYAAKAKKEPIHTFSIGFDEASFDESVYAKQIALHVKSEHHHKVLTGEDSLRVIPKVFAQLDEPMADASIIPTYLLSEFTREHVTVALGGDGGDELFGGYQTFQAEKIHQYLTMFPSGLAEKVLKGVAGIIPRSNSYMSNEFKLRKFIEGMNEENMARRHLVWTGTFNDAERKRLLLPDIRAVQKRADPLETGVAQFNSSPASDPHNKLLWMYQRTFMMDQVMVKVDRASMYNALETRAPFLDTDVVEFANSLPYHFKLKNFSGKHVLKFMLRGKIPDQIIDRTKKGFGVPVGAWLRGPLREWGEMLLSEENINASGVFAPEYIRELWTEHQSGKRDHRKRLWNILVFLEWKKRFS